MYMELGLWPCVGDKAVPRGKVGYHVVVVERTEDAVKFRQHVRGDDPVVLTNKLRTFLERFEPTGAL